MVAVPPGKGNGREHQDLRRRHLLVREIVNDPRTSNIAELRPSRKLSAYHGVFSSIRSLRLFRIALPRGRAWRDSHERTRPNRAVDGPMLTELLPVYHVTAASIAAAG